MQEQIMIYFISFLFGYSIIKGLFKGGVSELISIAFFIIGFFLATEIFENTFYRTVLSFILCIVIYNIGNFIAYFYKSQSFVDQILGAFFGIVKFFVMLITVTILALFMDSTPPIYTNNFFVKPIMPIAEEIKVAIENKKEADKKMKEKESVKI